MSNLPSTELAQPANTLQAYVFSNAQAFEAAQRMANALSSSTIVPANYQGKDKMPNCLVALEMAHRMGASVMQVMQNLHVIQGRPSWSSQFIIAAINTCGRFTPLRYQMEGEGDTRTCIAWAEDKTGERLESPQVSIAMAKKEGWYSKNGSKWQTMPELMLRYRAAAFFGRLYAPEVLMGMNTSEEVIDLGRGDYIEIKPDGSIIDNIQAQIEAEKAKVVEAQPEPETSAPVEETLESKAATTIIKTISSITDLSTLAEFQNEHGDFITSLYSSNKPLNKQIQDAFKGRFVEINTLAA